MKLAEALIERADLQTKLENLRIRIVNNSKVQEGLSPNENPEDLLKELDTMSSRLEYLIIHINQTNALSKNENGDTICSLIAQKDVLSKKISILNTMQEAGSQLCNRLTHTEIKIISTFNVANLQKNINNLSKKLRLIDTQIQSLNWTVDLI